jgi:preprotein translocase subunit SecG
LFSAVAEDVMQLAMYISLLVISFVLITLIVIQSRAAGVANRDTSSMVRTKRGVEKTLFQTTIALTATFLLLALVGSLPIF